MPFETSIHLAPNSLAGRKYIPGETVKGMVRLRCEGKCPGDLSSLQLVMMGTESISCGFEQSPTHVYFSKSITLAGQETEAQHRESIESRDRMIAYLLKNGRVALSGLVLDTHGNTYQEYLASDAQGTPEGDSRVPGGAAGEILREEILMDYPMRQNYSPGRAEEVGSLSLQSNLPYEFHFAFVIPPWCPPSFSFNTPEVSGLMQYKVQLIAVSGTGGKQERLSSKLFTVVSATPKRELLQAHERTNLRPVLSVTQRFRTFKKSSFARFFSPSPQGIIDIKVRFMGSACLVLRDTKTEAIAQLVHGGRSEAAASADPNGDYSGTFGTTVMGSVVRADSETIQPTTHSGAYRSFTPVKVLRLRVTVANGGFRARNTPADGDSDTIHRAKVSLYAKIRVKREGDLFDLVCRPICLAEDELQGSIPYGASSSFDVRLRLPPAFAVDKGAHSPTEVRSPKSPFRRSTTDTIGLSPPLGIQTSRVTVVSSLQVTFPDMKVAQEGELPDNLICLSEAVDLKDVVPNLPAQYKQEMDGT
ncbi:hypothetical protein AGDE_13353 [Angomonas deanei]|uniref:Arrestin (Or S-antigen), N-terminal domain containing protein n=1 Tax=Angomonas deanei TaxID=59799 RepID=A0A7G2C4B3_9TRYP|nr:hypothetical protein AGDE_13353 [Angomonas deanei]CAD2214638.1 hypothetical protein, conserved [Angomonas deanei]|eukprot:EPY22400.1 hypothetical protein AGDE_13353 [Angomonas deanei]